jgi:hypothetical protein
MPKGYKKDKEDTSLPGYELGSRGTQLRNCGIRIIECSSVELKVWL